MGSYVLLMYFIVFMDVVSVCKEARGHIGGFNIYDTFK